MKEGCFMFASMKKPTAMLGADPPVCLESLTLEQFPNTVQLTLVTSLVPWSELGGIHLWLVWGLWKSERDIAQPPVIRGKFSQ